MSSWSVVASVSLTNQTENQGSASNQVAIHTPESSGLFRLYGYLEVGPNQSDATILAKVRFVDDYAEKLKSTPDMNANIESSDHYDKVFRAAANQPISYYTYSSAGDLDYSIYFVLEEFIP